MSFELVSQFLWILVPIVYAVLAAVATYLAPFARRALSHRAFGSSLELLSTLATTGVANAHQTLVKDLKDPAQPGAWSAEAGASVKASVLRDVRALGADALRLLEARGLGPAAIDTLLNQLVEAAVVDLHQRLRSASTRAP